MNKKFLFILIIALAIAPISIVSAGNVSSKKLGVIVDIIDGDAMVMKFGDANVFIKLIGINTNASEQAVEYLNTHVKGKYAWVITEDLPNVNVKDTKYYNGYVYLQDTGEMINQTLLRLGLADLKTSASTASKYFELTQSHTEAKSKKVGIWQPEAVKNRTTRSSSSNYSYSGDCVNINTATAYQLRDLLDISSTIASNIVDYRRHNPFNTIEEIKFVKGVTKKVFDDIRDEITVITNINVASEKELLTLNGVTNSNVDSIINFRDTNGNFTSLDQFYKETNLSSSNYNDNKYFISLDYEEIAPYDMGDTVVNINTASRAQIDKAAGSVLTSSEVSDIADRRRGYSYKTLTEIRFISGVSISEEDINRLENNFKVYTDINNAPRSELESLFGNGYSSSEINEIENERPFNDITDIEDIIGTSKYNKIKNYIYVDEYEAPDRVNVNLADESDLDSLSISSSEVDRLADNHKDMEDSGDLPFNVEDIDEEVALYTDINTASESELKTLHNISSSLVDAIVDYRDDQPFGSKDEVKEFFEDENESTLYRYISNYIVVR